MDNIKTYIESINIANVEVFPVMDGIFEYSKVSDRLYYKHKLKSEIKFSNKNDYNIINGIRENECEEITLILKKKCGGVYTEKWRGVFKIFDCTINEDKCWISVKPKYVNEYKCFEDQYDDEQNIYGAGATTVVNSVGGTYEFVNCVASGGTCDGPPPVPPPINGCLGADADKWCMKSNRIDVYNIIYDDPANGYCDFYEWEHRTTWHREKATTTCVGGVPQEPIYANGWTLMIDDCAGSNTATFWRCPSDGEVAGDYDHGRTFENVINEILANIDCGLTVKSDFFNINPLADSPTNIAYTFATDYLHNLTVHQKSDIKRKDDTNPSGLDSWTLTLKKFMEDIQKIFNVWYVIENDVLILEHYSFFVSSIGLTVTGGDMSRKFTYYSNNNIEREIFQWVDEKSSLEFKANDIIYDCGEASKNHICSLFSTDLLYIENEDNKDNISDEGFVLVSNEIVSGNHVIINNNDALRWVNLHDNLHKHGRLLKSGRINGTSQTFLSWIPYMEQERVSVDVCCDTIFDPRDLIETYKGFGAVKSATHNIVSGKLHIKPVY